MFSYHLSLLKVQDFIFPKYIKILLKYVYLENRYFMLNSQVSNIQIGIIYFPYSSGSRCLLVPNIFLLH